MLGPEGCFAPVTVATSLGGVIELETCCGRSFGGHSISTLGKRADEREQGWFGCQDVGMALKGGAHFARYHAEHFRDLGYDLFTGSIRQKVRPVTDDTDA